MKSKLTLTLVFFMVFSVVFLPSRTLAVTSPDAFYNQYIGKSVDVDGFPAEQPYQCYDLWAKFIMDEYGMSKPIKIGPTGYAKDIWNNFDGLGLSTYFTKVTGSPQDGDWVIYGDCKVAPNSHVGMFRKDNGNGTITILEQNANGHPYVTQDSLTKDGILGYIRPNIYINGLPGTMTVSVPSVIYSGQDVVINWTASTNATKYGLSVWKAPYGSDQYLVWDNYVTGTSKDIGTLPIGNYRVQMKPYNSSGGGPVSNYVDFSVIQEPLPGAMTISVPSVIYAGQDVIINWTASTNATKYGLSVWKAPYGSDQYLVWDNYVTGTSKDIGTLPVGNYRVQMKPYNSSGGGPVSNYIDFSVIQAPEVPGSLNAESAGCDSIRISWAAVTEASGYELYRSASSGGTYSIVIGTTATSYINTGLTTGTTYYYKVRAYKTVGTTNVYGAYSAEVSAKPLPRDIQVIPLIGSDRYDTAAKLSQSQFAYSDSVIIVNGSAMADGLGATPLARYKNAPLLLTDTKSLPKVTIDEIKRLKANNAIIVGGTGVVSDEIKSQLQILGLTVDRISGSDRYGTSLEVAKYIDKNCYDVSRIVISYGYGEADALSIASAAGRDNMPIILVEKDNVPDAIYNWLASESIENAYIIGGTGVVSDNVLNKIDGITAADVRNNRLGGQDRFETNALVIDRFYGSVINKTYITKGYVLIDALAAGPVAAINGAPVVISDNDLTAIQKTVLSKRSGDTIIRTGGGISDTAVDSLENCLQ